MAEYTNIDAFAEDIRSRFCNKCNNALLAINCGDCWVDKALLEIENAPTADVIEAQYGKWAYPHYAPHGGSYVMRHCTLCEYSPPYVEDIIYEPYSYYCPNCGAKMGGKGDGE